MELELATHAAEEYTVSMQVFLIYVQIGFLMAIESRALDS